MAKKLIDIIKLEERVLFDAAGAADIVAAAEADTAAQSQISETESKAAEEREALKNAPPENVAADQAAASGKADDPAENADVDAAVQALVEGEIPQDADGDDDADAAVREFIELADGDDADDANDEPGFIEAFQAPEAAERELVIVNSSVKKVDEIVNALGENTDVLYLENGTDALDAINGFLDSNNDVKYSAIHIVSHGNAGYFVLNGEIIDGEAVANDPASWKNIGEHMTDDGDIMLYACNLAGNEQGQLLISEIADLTGADVAASTDNTGAKGDWDLEYSVGMVDSGSINAQDYAYSLKNWVVDDGHYYSDPDREGTLFWALVNADGGDDITLKVDAQANLASNDGRNTNPKTGLPYNQITLADVTISGNFTAEIYGYQYSSSDPASSITFSNFTVDAGTTLNIRNDVALSGTVNNFGTLKLTDGGDTVSQTNALELTNYSGGTIVAEAQRWSSLKNTTGAALEIHDANVALNSFTETNGTLRFKTNYTVNTALNWDGAVYVGGTDDSSAMTLTILDSVSFGELQNQSYGRIEVGIGGDAADSGSLAVNRIANKGTIIVNGGSTLALAADAATRVGGTVEIHNATLNCASTMKFSNLGYWFDVDVNGSVALSDWVQSEKLDDRMPAEGNLNLTVAGGTDLTVDTTEYNNASYEVAVLGGLIFNTDHTPNAGYVAGQPATLPNPDYDPSIPEGPDNQKTLPNLPGMEYIFDPNVLIGSLQNNGTVTIAEGTQLVIAGATSGNGLMAIGADTSVAYQTSGYVFAGTYQTLNLQGAAMIVAGSVTVEKELIAQSSTLGDSISVSVGAGGDFTISGKVSDSAATSYYVDGRMRFDNPDSDERVNVGGYLQVGDGELTVAAAKISFSGWVGLGAGNGSINIVGAYTEFTNGFTDAMGWYNYSGFVTGSQVDSLHESRYQISGATRSESEWYPASNVNTWFGGIAAYNGTVTVDTAGEVVFSGTHEVVVVSEFNIENAGKVTFNSDLIVAAGDFTVSQNVTNVYFNDVYVSTQYRTPRETRFDSAAKNTTFTGTFEVYAVSPRNYSYDGTSPYRWNHYTDYFSGVNAAGNEAVVLFAPSGHERAYVNFSGENLVFNSSISLESAYGMVTFTNNAAKATFGGDITNNGQSRNPADGGSAALVQNRVSTTVGDMRNVTAAWGTGHFMPQSKFFLGSNTTVNGTVTNQGNTGSETYYAGMPWAYFVIGDNNFFDNVTSFNNLGGYEWTVVDINGGGNTFQGIFTNNGALLKVGPGESSTGSNVWYDLRNTGVGEVMFANSGNASVNITNGANASLTATESTTNMQFTGLNNAGTASLLGDIKLLKEDIKGDFVNTGKLFFNGHLVSEVNFENSGVLTIAGTRAGENSPNVIQGDLINKDTGTLTFAATTVVDGLIANNGTLIISEGVQGMAFTTVNNLRASGSKVVPTMHLNAKAEFQVINNEGNIYLGSTASGTTIGYLDNRTGSKTTISGSISIGMGGLEEVGINNAGSLTISNSINSVYLVKGKEYRAKVTNQETGTLSLAQGVDPGHENRLDLDNYGSIDVSGIMHFGDVYNEGTIRLNSEASSLCFDGTLNHVGGIVGTGSVTFRGAMLGTGDDGPGYISLNGRASSLTYDADILDASGNRVFVDQGFYKVTRDTAGMYTYNADITISGPSSKVTVTQDISFSEGKSFVLAGGTLVVGEGYTLDLGTTAVTLTSGALEIAENAVFRTVNATFNTISLTNNGMLQVMDGGDAAFGQATRGSGLLFMTGGNLTYSAAGAEVQTLYAMVNEVEIDGQTVTGTYGKLILSGTDKQIIRDMDIATMENNMSDGAKLLIGNSKNPVKVMLGEVTGSADNYKIDIANGSELALGSSKVEASGNFGSITNKGVFSAIVAAGSTVNIRNFTNSTAAASTDFTVNGTLNIQGAVTNNSDMTISGSKGTVNFGGTVKNAAALNAAAKTLNFSGITNSGEFTAAAGRTLTFGGNITNSSEFTVDGAETNFSADVVNEGKFAANGKNMTFSGNVTNSGTFNAAGTVSTVFSSAFVNQAGGTVNAAAGTKFNGGVDNAGTLNVNAESVSFGALTMTGSKAKLNFNADYTVDDSTFGTVYDVGGKVYVRDGVTLTIADRASGTTMNFAYVDVAATGSLVVNAAGGYSVTYNGEKIEAVAITGGGAAIGTLKNAGAVSVTRGDAQQAVLLVDNLENAGMVKALSQGILLVKDGENTGEGRIEADGMNNGVYIVADNLYYRMWINVDASTVPAGSVVIAQQDYEATYGDLFTKANSYAFNITDGYTLTVNSKADALGFEYRVQDGGTLQIVETVMIGGAVVVAEGGTVAVDQNVVLTFGGTVTGAGSVNAAENSTVVYQGADGMTGLQGTYDKLTVSGNGVSFNGDVNAAGTVQVFGENAAFRNLTGAEITFGEEIDGSTAGTGVSAKSVTATAGNVTVGSSVGSYTFENVTASDDVTLGGTGEISGNVTATENITVTGKAELAGNVKASGVEVQIGADAAFGGIVDVVDSLNVDGTAAFSGNVIAADVNVNGSAEFGNVTATGNVTVGADGTASFGDVDAEILTVEGNGTFNGTADVINVNVSGTADFNKNVIATGDVTVDGSAEFNGDMNASGTLSGNGNVVFNGGANADGGADMGESSSVTYGGSNVSVIEGTYGSLNTNGDNVTVSGVEIAGDVSFGGVTNTSGEVTIDGNAAIAGKLNNDGELTFNGNVSADKKVEMDSAGTVNYNGTGDIVSGTYNDLNIGGDDQTAGGITVNGTMQYTGSGLTVETLVNNGNAELTEAAGSVVFDNVENSGKLQIANSGNSFGTVENTAEITVSGDDNDFETVDNQGVFTVSGNRNTIVEFSNSSEASAAFTGADNVITSVSNLGMFSFAGRNNAISTLDNGGEFHLDGIKNSVGSISNSGYGVIYEGGRVWMVAGGVANADNYPDISNLNFSSLALVLGEELRGVGLDILYADGEIYLKRRVRPSLPADDVSRALGSSPDFLGLEAVYDEMEFDGAELSEEDVSNVLDVAEVFTDELNAAIDSIVAE